MKEKRSAQKFCAWWSEISKCVTGIVILLRASCLMLEIKEFRCYEAKIEESERPVVAWGRTHAGQLWLQPPVFCHWATSAEQPPTPTILYMYCTGGTQCLSHTPGSHSVCAIKTPLGVDQKIGVRKTTQHGFYPDGENFPVNPYSTTCAIHIMQDCGGWWWSGCCGSVAEHWQLKVWLLATTSLLAFLYFRLIISTFLY